MILKPGTFKTRDFRKQITDRVKNAVLIRQGNKAPDGVAFTVEDALSGNIKFDHRPPLESRPYDTEAGDFIPPQLDPASIEALRSAQHDQRTFGRKEGAERVVTTRGSDAGEASRARNIADTEKIHGAKMALKAGDHRRAGDLLASVSRRGRLKPKRKLRSRGFAPGYRPMRGRSSSKEENKPASS